MRSGSENSSMQYFVTTNIELVHTNQIGFWAAVWASGSSCSCRVTSPCEQMASDICQDCGVKATTFKDPNDGGLYCLQCWTQFYGSPPVHTSTAKPKESTGESKDSKDLPEDAPRGHPAHSAVKYQSAKKVFSFQWHGSGGSRIPFQTTVPAAGNSRWAAEVIARACYMKFEQGWTKEKILEWRNQCYARLGGRPPSMLTSQAASQRASRHSEAPERSRSRCSERKRHIPPFRTKQIPKDLKEGVKSSKSPGEAFLPPNHLKLLLDDPQAPLPKSQVKIRSQAFAFSQSQMDNPKNSQDERLDAGFSQMSEGREASRPAAVRSSCLLQGAKDILDRGAILLGRAQTNLTPKYVILYQIVECFAKHKWMVPFASATEKIQPTSSGRGSHCCCCRARSRKEDWPRPQDSKAQGPCTAKFEGVKTGVEVANAELEKVKGESQHELKRKKSEDDANLMLKRLKEEPPESQHRPETQPTPFIYEPPVLEKEPTSDTLPTPPVELPTPIPEPPSLPMPNLVRETIVTPWCTQPTPKVDAADCVFISDQTPMPPAKEDDDAAAAPALTQPTPVPPAPAANEKPHATQGEKDNSFADTAIDKAEMEAAAPAAAPAAVPAEDAPAAAPPDSAIPTVSLDVMPNLDRTAPSVVPAKRNPIELAPPGPSASTSAFNFAALLLQRSRAAAAKRQTRKSETDLAPAAKTDLVDFALPKPKVMNKLKVFVSENVESEQAKQAEQAPESTHPPAQTAPEDAYPLGFGTRATIWMSAVLQPLLCFLGEWNWIRSSWVSHVEPILGEAKFIAAILEACVQCLPFTCFLAL